MVGLVCLLIAPVHDLRRLCHVYHYYNSTATTAKPATLLPLLQSLQLYCPSAIRMVGLFVLTSPCALNDLRLTILLITSH